MTEPLLGDINAFTYALIELYIKETKIPEVVKIPHWPMALRTVKIDLGFRDYLYPVLSETSGMFRVERRQHFVEFSVYRDGVFRFSFSGTKPPLFSRSDEKNEIDRIRALVLFRQFKDEICEKLLEVLKQDVAPHNETMTMLEDALAPFIPYIIADKMSQ